MATRKCVRCDYPTTSMGFLKAFADCYYEFSGRKSSSISSVFLSSTDPTGRSLVAHADVEAVWAHEFIANTIPCSQHSEITIMWAKQVCACDNSLVFCDMLCRTGVPPVRADAWAACTPHGLNGSFFSWSVPICLFGTPCHTPRIHERQSNHL